MRPKALLMMLLMLLCFSMARATDEVQIGTYSNYMLTEYFPTSFTYNYSLVEQIYTASEIGRSGYITSISFYRSWTDVSVDNLSSQGLKLYMKNVSKTRFDSESEIIPVSDEDLVWEGTFATPAREYQGWITISLDRAFNYNGSDNLLVCFYDDNEQRSYGSTNRFAYGSTQGNALAYESMNDVPDLEDLGSFPGYKRMGSCPIIKIGFGSEIVEIDVPSFENYSLPTDEYYKYFLSQQIYTKSELGAAKTITSIAFDNRTLMERTRTLDLYLVPTDKQKFTISTDEDTGNDWISFSDQYKVFSGTVVFGQTFGWKTITFDTPFEYDGSSNLAVIMVDNTGEVNDLMYGFRAISSDDQSIYLSSDEANFTASSLTEELYGNIRTYKNLIQINGETVYPTNSYLPSYVYYNYSLTQQIYNSYEIGDAKDITSVSFFNTGNERKRNLDIYLVPTSKTYFDDNYGWENVTEANKVFSGDVTFESGKWTAIGFDKAYSYNGTDNLVLVVDDNTGSYQNAVPFLAFDATEQSLSIYSDGINYDPQNASDYEGNVLSQKNMIRFNERGLDTAPTSIEVTEVEWDKAKVSWEGEGQSYNLQYKPKYSDEWTTKYSLEAKTYTLTNLEEQTTYDVRVQINGIGSNRWLSTQFTTDERFLKPTDLEVLAVTPYTAVLDWSDNCGAIQWEVGVSNSEESREVLTSNKPFVLTGLNPNTGYYIAVRSVMDAENNLYSNWCSDVYLVTPAPNPIPTDLAVSPTPTSATISWEGSSGSYVVKYRKPTPKAGTTFDFDDGTLQGWTTIDADGDGNTWVSSAEPGIYHSSGVDLTGKGYDGSAHFVLSGSYANQTSQALTPDNYLVSPSMELGGKIGFYACAQDAGYSAEHFGVAVSTASNTDASAFTTIAEWTLTAAGTPSSRRKVIGTWGLFEVDLSDYEGQTGYVAIRHFGCSDQFILNIDDINIVRYDEIVEEPWQTIETTATTVTIDGLESETTYEFVIVGIKSGCEDASSSIQTFTTLPNNPTPSDIAVKPFATTATISWTGYSDAYDVYYREGGNFFEDFESGSLAEKGWTVNTVGEHLDGHEGWYIESDFDSALSGTHAVVARSWANTTVYNADNWLISPIVMLGGTLKYWEACRSSYPDSYEVLLSTTGKATSDFTIELRPMAPANTTNAWMEVTIDLSAYAGQTGYIAFHHVDIDKMYLYLDDIGIYMDSSTPSEWNTVRVYDPGVTLEGLNPNSSYEFYLTGVARGTDGSDTFSEPSHTFTFITESDDPINIVFDDKESNSSAIFANNDKFANVTINNRTFKKDGTWQSICLPFGLDVENSVLKGADVRTLESVTIVGSVAYLNCPTPQTELLPATPYIIRWNNGGSDIVNPVFKGVTIVKGVYPIKVDNATFTAQSSYSYYMASGDFPGFYYVTGGPTLSPIMDGAEIKAFDAYFQMGSAVFSGVDTFVLNTDDISTGIASLKGGVDEVIYNIAGQRLAKKQRGINIINGKKVLIK